MKPSRAATPASLVMALALGACGGGGGGESASQASAGAAVPAPTPATSMSSATGSVTTAGSGPNAAVVAAPAPTPTPTPAPGPAPQPAAPQLSNFLGQTLAPVSVKSSDGRYCGWVSITQSASGTATRTTFSIDYQVCYTSKWMPPVQGSITWGNGYWNGYGFLGLEYPTPFSNPLVDPSLFVPAGGNTIGLNVNAPGACVTFSNVDGYQARWCTAPIGAEYRGYGGEVIAFVPGGW